MEETVSQFPLFAKDPAEVAQQVVVHVLEVDVSALAIPGEELEGILSLYSARSEGQPEPIWSQPRQENVLPETLCADDGVVAETIIVSIVVESNGFHDFFSKKLGHKVTERRKNGRVVRGKKPNCPHSRNKVTKFLSGLVLSGPKVSSFYN